MLKLGERLERGGLWFASLLDPDLIHLSPYAGEFSFSGLIFVDAGCEAQGCECYPHAPDFLGRFTGGATEDIVYKLVRFVLGAARGLNKLQSLLQEPVVPLVAIPRDLESKTGK